MPGTCGCSGLNVTGDITKLRGCPLGVIARQAYAPDSCNPGNGAGKCHSASSFTPISAP